MKLFNDLTAIKSNRQLSTRGITMKFIRFTSKGFVASALVSISALVGSMGVTGIVNAQAGTSLTATQQQRLQTIISKGDQEIMRRLTMLNTLTSKINAATKLTASDKATLSNEVDTTISGLTSLKTTLDTETSLTAARADVQNIYTEYRVYALVAPKIALVKVADDQQVVEAKLTALAQKLQTRITTLQQAGKDVTSLQSSLTDMNNKIAAAQAVSSQIQAKVINLQPTDYNSDHAILSGDRDQLKTAHEDNQAAYNDAKTIIAALKTMK